MTLLRRHIPQLPYLRSLIDQQYVAASVQQLQTLFATPSCQGCVEAANNQKPNINVPRVHTHKATMWNNIYETDEVEFEDYIISEFDKSVKKRKAKTRQGYQQFFVCLSHCTNKLLGTR